MSDEPMLDGFGPEAVTPPAGPDPRQRASAGVLTEDDERGAPDNRGVAQRVVDAIRGGPEEEYADHNLGRKT
jgi:hypothetical protein